MIPKEKEADLDQLAGSDPSNAKKGRTPGQDARHFKTDKTGKLIINEEEPSSNGNAAADPNGEGTAFIAAQRGVDGMRRDERGNLKFNRNTKRSRDEEIGVDLDEYLGEKDKGKGGGGKKKKGTGQGGGVGRLGEEFRAKVSYL
jgi:ribosomal RNA-processing protein 12